MNMRRTVALLLAKIAAAIPNWCHLDPYPDRIIGGKDDPYLKRWYIIPRNPLFNIYLHHFLRSDDDRALHDHPWYNISVLLTGSYWEHVPAGDGWILPKLRKAWRPWAPWRVYIRRPVAAHRIELRPDLKTGKRESPVWTLFITGPRVREWGFLCKKGWVHWRIFTDPKDTGSVGRGCE